MLDLTLKEWYLENFKSRSQTLINFFKAMDSVDSSNLSTLRLAIGDVQTVLEILYEDASHDLSEAKTPDESRCLSFMGADNSLLMGPRSTCHLEHVL